MAVSGTKAVEASAVAGEFAAAAAIGVGGSEKSGSSSSGSGGGGVSVVRRCAKSDGMVPGASAAGEDRLPRLAFVPEPLAEAGEGRLEIGDLVDLEGVLGDIGVGGRVDVASVLVTRMTVFVEVRGSPRKAHRRLRPSLPGAGAFGHGLLVRYLIYTTWASAWAPKVLSFATIFSRVIG